VQGVLVTNSTVAAGVKLITAMKVKPKPTKVNDLRRNWYIIFVFQFVSKPSLKSFYMTIFVRISCVNYNNTRRGSLTDDLFKKI